MYGLVVFLTSSILVVTVVVTVVVIVVVFVVVVVVIVVVVVVVIVAVVVSTARYRVSFDYFSFPLPPPRELEQACAVVVSEAGVYGRR